MGFFYQKGYNRKGDQTENAWSAATDHENWEGSAIGSHTSGPTRHPVQLLRSHGDGASMQHMQWVVHSGRFFHDFYEYDMNNH